MNTKRTVIALNYPIEQMKKIYILTETYQLLLQKQEQLRKSAQSDAAITNDLYKIERELLALSGEDDINGLLNKVNEELVFPDFEPDDEQGDWENA
jgi:hypothetical protein